MTEPTRQAASPPDARAAADDGAGRRHLGIWGCISIIVGIVVGVSIFKVPALVFGNVAGPWQGLGAWLLGGALSVAGALCYAELATGHPRVGGDYAYLNRAFHPLAGYLFGWGRLTVIQAGSIGALAYVFADYAAALWPGIPPAGFAIGVVAALTLVNILGVELGKGAQNILTVAKVAALGGIVLAGLALGRAHGFSLGEPAAVAGPGFGLAMILILYAYGGWNEAAFVAAEMHDPARSIPRALILSTCAITLFYLLVNAAYLLGLGFAGLRASEVPAADILGQALGTGGMRAMGLVVMLSVLGALNGTILTGSRVYVAMGADHRPFALLGRWSPRWCTPAWAFAVQALIAMAMIAAVGTGAGQAAIDRLLAGAGLAPLPWAAYGGGFNTLVAGTAPVFWAFFLLSGISLFVLRHRGRGAPRPFSVPLYPVLPLVFCATCAYMLHSSIAYARGLALFWVALMALGVPLYLLGRRRAAACGEAPPAGPHNPSKESAP